MWRLIWKSVQAQALSWYVRYMGKVAEPCTSIMQGQDVAFKNREEWGPHGLNSAPLHQQMMRSSKTSTYVTCKSQHENQHFLNHHRQWTQQIMSGNSTNRAFCYHEQCPTGTLSAPANSQQLQDLWVSNCNLHLLQGFDAQWFVGARVGRHVKTLWHETNRTKKPLNQTRTLMSNVHKSCSGLLVDCNINVNKVICLNEWNFNFSCALCSWLYISRSPYLEGNLWRF